MLRVVGSTTQAFESACKEIINFGVERNSTKGKWWSVFNVGFKIVNPLDNNIVTPWRKWKLNYASAELAWYLSKDRKADFIEKHASMWTDLKDEDGLLNSNYGHLMWEEGQYDSMIKKLQEDDCSRQAILTLYDGKRYLNMDTKDVPCTLNLCFNIVDSRLRMTVMMRSNDAYLGLPNDNFCFSMIQKMVADELKLEVGIYFHFVFDLHLYEKHYNIVKQNMP